MNLSSEPFGSPRLNTGGLPSARAQAEGLKVHPEPRFFTPPSKTGLRAAERVKQKVPYFLQGHFIFQGNLKLGIVKRL